MTDDAPSKTDGSAKVDPPRASMLRTTLVVTVAQVLFRGGEAILPLLLAHWFGRTSAMDVYFFAWAVFAFAGALVFTAYKDSPLVPILAEEKLARPEGVPRLVGSLLVHTWVIGGMLAMAVGGIALAWFLIRYSGSELALAMGMVIPFTVYLVATATRTFFATLLSVEHHFIVQPIASGLGMVLQIGIVALLHGRFGVVIVPIAAVANEIFVTLIFAWYAIRIIGLRVELNYSRPEALVSFAKLVAHQVGGGAVTRINPVIDQLMAGLSGVVGAGTMLLFTGDAAELPIGLLQASMLPVLLSHLSDHYAKRDLVSLRREVVKSLRIVCTLLACAAVIIYFVRGPILRLVFLHGEMDAGGVERMIQLMPYHLVGLAPVGALLILARAHIALKNTGIFIGMGIFNASSNAVLNIVFLKLLGLEGIALATSVTHLMVAIVFWFKLGQRLARGEAPSEAAGEAAGR